MGHNNQQQQPYNYLAPGEPYIVPSLRLEYQIDQEAFFRARIAHFTSPKSFTFQLFEGKGKVDLIEQDLYDLYQENLELKYPIDLKDSLFDILAGRTYTVYSRALRRWVRAKALESARINRHYNRLTSFYLLDYAREELHFAWNVRYLPQDLCELPGQGFKGTVTFSDTKEWTAAQSSHYRSKVVGRIFPCFLESFKEAMGQGPENVVYQFRIAQETPPGSKIFEELMWDWTPEGN